MVQNTNETLQDFIVTRDGSIDEELTPSTPNVAEAVLGGLQAATEAIKLQASMYVYDRIHGTAYRSIRNALVKEKKNRQYEASIGIERVI